MDFARNFLLFILIGFVAVMACNEIAQWLVARCEYGQCHHRPNSWVHCFILSLRERPKR